MGKKRKGPIAGGGSDDGDIHTAARNGDLATVQSICLSNPLAVNSRDKHSRTPYPLFHFLSWPPVMLPGFLNLHCIYVHSSVLEELVSCWTSSSLGFSLLVAFGSEAAWADQVEVVSYLCKNKADVGAAAMDDMGAIHFAAQKGHLEVVRILLTSGVSVNSSNRKGFTPLHYAVQGSHLELAKYLVRKGSSLSCKNKSGKTPFDLASNEETHSLLVECETEFKYTKEVKKSKEDDNTIEEHLGPQNEENVGQSASPKPEKEKTEGEEAENKLSLPERKKPKVALNHLLTGDDIKELGEENA